MLVKIILLYHNCDMVSFHHFFCVHKEKPLIRTYSFDKSIKVNHGKRSL